MLVAIRRESKQLIGPAGQVLLLFIAARIGTREGWLYCLPAMAALSLISWRSALIHLRAIRDTPTSKIASAAQGYVELIGRGKHFGDTPLLSKLRFLPCLWYRYTIEERSGTSSNDKWRTIDKGESPDSFMLDDGSGICVVDPEEAEISTIYRDQWRDGDMRYTEWKLLPNDLIYVLGEFRTRNSATEFNSNAELNALLAEWKRDMPALHKRFDLNNDGMLDMDEWMLARKAAKREIEKRMREVHAVPDLHIISQPADGKLFLISNLTPKDLSRRFLYWCWAHVGTFFATMTAIGWLLQKDVLI